MSAHHRTAAWRRVTRIARPIIAASLPAPCVNRCRLGGMVIPGQRWDVAHIVDQALGGTDDLSNLGPAHVQCNRADGGRLGAKRANDNARRRKATPPW